ncbi:MAG: hypothetical protein IKH97_00610 [Bacteroidales bacterium]|nr:hypothetical protein [Bacteroidales bacterium]
MNQATASAVPSSEGCRDSDGVCKIKQINEASDRVSRPLFRGVSRQRRGM